MSSFMLFEQNSEQVAKPASKVLMESAGFDYVDGELCFIFSTSEGKRGYGKQAIPVKDIDECYQVLSEAADNGVQSEDYVPTTPEIIKKSLIQSEDGSIRFKTQAQKGKKPTYIVSDNHFTAFVSKLGELLPMIKEKANEISGSQPESS